MSKYSKNSFFLKFRKHRKRIETFQTNHLLCGYMYKLHNSYFVKFVYVVHFGVNMFCRAAT